MRVFENHAQLQTALDIEPGRPGAFRFLSSYGPAGFRCADCGKVSPFPFEGIGTGYARTGDDDRMICYPCADASQRREMTAHAGPFYCYLSGDGQHVTTWTGGQLGKVHALGASRAGWHGSEIARFHVRDGSGRWWIGRGAGRGMCCTLRPMKHAPTYARSWNAVIPAKAA